MMNEETRSIWIGDGPIADFDRAYDNGAAVQGSEAFSPHWADAAARFRDELTAKGRAEIGTPYGPRPRQHYDLFRPEDSAKGLVVFVHGGYWHRQSISNFSHLSAGALSRGFAVAVPEYTLCPEATISEITREIAAFLGEIAGRFDGPIRLSGHSAGGHLVSRMICRDIGLSHELAARIDRVASISGVHDLRPLLRTKMNAVLKLDEGQARAESPALLEPRENADLFCVTGGAELSEFRRQNALLANVWCGLGARVSCFERPGKHHFDIIDDLVDADSRLVRYLTEL